MNRLLTALAVLTGVLALTSCGYSEPNTPGVVTARSPHHNPATHSEEWWLTIRQPDGSSTTFRVLIDTYDRCPISARYPACKTGTTTS